MAIEFRNPESSDFSIPGPVSENVRYFSSSTQEHFRQEMARSAIERGRKVFIEHYKGGAKTVGVTQIHRVIGKSGEEVRLSGSHARHRLSPGIELAAGRSYELAIDPASNVILRADVTSEAKPEAQGKPLSAYEIHPASDLLPVSLTEAQALFSRVRRQPHIPFQYPSNGCWARAHEMCRLIECHFDPNKEIVVAKIWNFGTLSVHTDNNPDCEVPWGFHVAPVVRTSDELLVIDPALFDHPVNIDCWRRRQSDLSKHYIFTDWSAYNLQDENDLLFTSADPRLTEEELRNFWVSLIALIYKHGPLPYSCGGIQHDQAVTQT